MDKDKETLNKLVLIIVAYILGILSSFLGIGLIMQSRIQEALTVPQSRVVRE
ncbi:MAG: hypothetical protein HC908_00530 [Calothrix sp. SM1_7_51]|nr:hypothetical protein [Calothrix sp. SM1_7_51]